MDYPSLYIHLYSPLGGNFNEQTKNHDKITHITLRYVLIDTIVNKYKAIYNNYYDNSNDNFYSAVA